MKSLIYLAAVLAMPAAMASYNTDALKGDVTCDDASGEMSVTLNAARTIISISSDGDQKPVELAIQERVSDGDTYVAYNAGLNSQPVQAVLYLDDQGDRLEYNGVRTDLTCPE